MNRIIPKGSKPADIVRAINTMIRDIDPAKSWKVTIEEVKSKRSDPQNAFLWGVCYPSILEGGGEMLRGWNANDLHEFFLGEHFGWEVMEGFGRKRMRPVRRSSKLSKTEFSDYLEYLSARCADMGIVIPEPEYVDKQ